MVLEGRKRRVEHEEGDEEMGYSGFDENPGEEYLGEEELEEGEHDSSQKTKQDQTPLWKYATRLEAGKGGGTTKFNCSHCNNDYTGSYAHARKYLCGKRPWDGDKRIGIKSCAGVSAAERAKYIREEEESQYKSKKSKVFFEPSSQSHVFENYILRSNGTHKILQKYKHRKCTKQERHRYTWFTQFGLRPPRTASPSFSIIQQNEETQPTANPL